jgi:uncharacterized membrane protein
MKKQLTWYLEHSLASVTIVGMTIAVGIFAIGFHSLFG